MSTEPSNPDPIDAHAKRIDELVERLERDLPNPEAVSHAGRSPPPEIPRSLREAAHAPKPGVVKWKPDDRPGRGSSEMARAFVLGSNFVFSVAGMTALGWALERWVWPKATPWLILAGCVLGLVGGTYNFIRQGNKDNR